MKIEFTNLTETELEELRTFEKENSDQCMLAITEDAFDGIAVAALILAGIQTAVAIIALIQQWKPRNANEIVITIHSPGENVTRIKLKDASEDMLLSILKLYP